MARFTGLRAEAEWLVPHLCERVDAIQAFALWGPVLRAHDGGALVLATTNYDRAIERANSKAGVAITDGFAAFEGRELVRWAGFGSAAGVRLLKVHGSTDWYDGLGVADIWKLRHAMPLYGNVRIAIEGSEVNLGSALVLPSREKKVTSAPYPDLAFQFRKAIEEAEIVVFIGFSLRDPDLLELARQAAARVPTLVVNRHGRTEGPGQAVAMSASRFLISVAPRNLVVGLRGIYTIGEKATAEYEKARAKFARFINAPDAHEIVFTRNATEAINLVAYSWGRRTSTRATRSCSPRWSTTPTSSRGSSSSRSATATSSSSRSPTTGSSASRCSRSS